MCLGPLELAWLALHFEVLVAFGTAEAEGAGVVADEGDAFGGVAGGGAEVAGFDSGGMNGGSVGGKSCLLGMGDREGFLPHVCCSIGASCGLCL